MRTFKSFYQSRPALTRIMQAATSWSVKNIRKSIGATSQQRLRRLANFVWNDFLLLCATIAATTLIMLYVVVNSLLIIYEIMAMCLTTLQSIIYRKKQGSTPRSQKNNF
jgi:hypothetical protein